MCAGSANAPPQMRIRLSHINAIMPMVIVAFVSPWPQASEDFFINFLTGSDNTDIHRVNHASNIDLTPQSSHILRRSSASP